MKSPASISSFARPTRIAARIGAAYVLFSALWILGSDTLLNALVADPGSRNVVQLAKGWGYVVVSGLLLFYFVRRAFDLTLQDRPRSLVVLPGRRLRTTLLQMAVAAAVVATLTAGAVAYAFSHYRHQQSAQLQAVAELQARYVGEWLRERLAESQFINSSTQFANLYRQWRDGKDTAARARLLERLVEFRSSTMAKTVSVLTEHGDTAALEDGSVGPVEPEVREAAMRALATGQPQHTGVYFHAGTELPLRIDFVVPLAQLGNAPRGTVVMRIDPRSTIFPILKNWPQASDTAESDLWRKVGNEVLAQSNFRSRPEAAGLLRFKADDPSLLVSAFLRGEVRQGEIAEALDYAGEPVLGAARAVPGSDWILVAKISTDEATAGARRDAAWIIAAGTLVLLAALAGLWLARDRQNLRLALMSRAAEERRASTRNLLDTLINSSPDVIYAKDLQGRYTLFNQEAERASGKSREEILGRDDTALFSPLEAAALMANDAAVIRENRTLGYEDTLTTTTGAVVYSALKGPLRDAAGTVIGVFGISRDITQRRITEARLRASEQRLRLFVEHAPAAIAMLDNQMRYLVVSRRWMLDYRLAERDVTDLSHYEVLPEVPERWKQIHQRALGGEPQRSDADAFPRADGSVDWVKWEIQPWRDAEGAIGGIMMFTELITERKQSRAALQESSELVQAVSDSMVQQMAVIDRQGVIVAVNASWRQFAVDNPSVDGVMRPRHAMIGDNYLEITSPDRNDAGAEARRAAVPGIREVLEGLRTQFSLDYSLGGPDANSGARRWYQLTVTPLRTAAGGALILRTDITQRRLAEAAVRDSEAHYRSMVSALSEGVVIFGLDGSVKEANPSAQAILGLTAQTLLDRNRVLADWKPVHRDGRPYRHEDLPLSRVIATGRPVHNVIVGDVDAQGTVTWLLVNAEPVADASTGELTAVVLSFTNVTDRHAAEEQLRKLSMAVEQNPASIFITALDGTIEYVNETFVKATGYSREEAIGRTPRLLMSGQTPHAVFESLWQTLGAGRPWRGEIVNRRKNGELFTELSLVVPIHEPGGRITHYLAMQDDVTAQKDVQSELDRYRHRLEELVEQRTAQLESTNRALTDSERLVRTMTDNTPAAIAYWDKDLRCRFANREYRARFGPRGDDITAKHISDVLGQADYDGIRGKLDAVLAGQAQHYQRVINEQSPDPIYYWVDFIPDLLDGQVQGFFVLSSNVTALKRAEFGLQQANTELVAARDKAESANRAKSSFLANMSHEIRTPMNAIIGLTWLLSNDSRDPRDAARLGQVSEAAHHLLSVINDILDLSKIESGKLVLEDTDFQLDALLSRTCALVAERARAKGLDLRVDTDHLPSLMRGDPTRLAQALINLLGNAVKFTASGFIELRGDLLDDTGDELLVRFSVRDSGIGIAAETSGSLFDAFVQADSSITRRHGGTGLGLAITRHLAELMGGSVGVQSEAGEGSTFWFTARLHRAHAHPAEPLPDTPGRRDAADALRREHAGQRVLVAEDNPVNQDVAVELLRAAGLQVDVAANGLQAVEMAQHQPYALILMDMQMPEMDGLRATRAIRQFARHSTTPIVSLTANVFGEDQAACMAAGMNDHLAKPVDPQRLYEVMLRWLPVSVPVPADLQAARSLPPPAAEAPAARPWLSGIPGFDARRGEQLIGGNTAAYLRLLRQFMRHYGDGLADLPGLLARGELDDARLVVHSLKGAAATVGAERIRESASALEAALRSGAATGDIEDAAVQLRHALSLLLQALGERLADAPSEEAAEAAQRAGSPARSGGKTAAAPTHTPSASELLDALQALLERADFGAAALYRQARMDLRNVLGEGPGLEGLEQSLEQHDHPAALGHLLRLRGLAPPQNGAGL